MEKDEKNNISKILSSALQGKLAPEDEVILNEWLDSDVENQKLYYKLQDGKYLKNELSLIHEFEYSSKKLKIISSPKTRYRKLLLPWIAAASLLIAIVPILLYEKNESSVFDEILVFNHADVKALLIFEDGDTLQLNDNLSTEWIHKRHDIFEENSIKPTKWNTLVVPRGGEYTITLSDGSIVWLNSDSWLKFPDKFPDSIRLVELYGEGYFEVTSDTKQPFIVNSENISVHVKGTSFIHKYYPNESIQTTLFSGSVYVSDTKMNVEILPGHRVSYHDELFYIDKFDIDFIKDWKERFIFENELFVNVIKQLERWYDFKIVVVDESINRLRFTGNLSKYENAEIVLRYIELTAPIKFEIENNLITVQKEK